MLTYSVVNLETGFNEDMFNQFKQNGIVENSFATTRKSLDNTKCILKWTGDIPADLSSYVLWYGSLEQMHEYLATNSSAWQNADGLLLMVDT